MCDARLQYISSFILSFSLSFFPPFPLSLSSFHPLLFLPLLFPISPAFSSFPPFSTTSSDMLICAIVFRNV